MEASAYFKRFIRWPAIFMLIGIVLVGGFFYEAERYQQSLQQQAQREKTQLNRLVQEVNFLRSQYQLYLTYGDQYLAVLEQGLTNKQDRVRWTDMLLREHEKWVISPMDIQFSAQKPLQRQNYAHLKVSRNIFYETAVSLHLGVHSDLDLFYLLSSMERQISHFYLVKSCEQKIDLRRASKQSKSSKSSKKNQASQSKSQSNPVLFDPTTPILHASCQLIFFNAKPKPFKALNGQSSHHRRSMQGMKE